LLGFVVHCFQYQASRLAGKRISNILCQVGRKNLKQSSGWLKIVQLYQPVPKAVHRSGCCDKHKAMMGFDHAT